MTTSITLVPRRSRKKLPPKTALFYGRKSSVFIDKQADSIERQREECFVRFGTVPQVIPSTDIPGWYEDDLSGKNFNRPGFNDLLALCEANPMKGADRGTIYCYHNNRFSRSLDPKTGKATPKESEYWFLHFWRLGWDVKFLHGANTGSEFGDDLMRQVEWRQGSDYLVDLATSVTDGKYRWAEKGYWQGGPPPFGAARMDERNGRILLDARRDPVTRARVQGEWGQPNTVVLCRHREHGKLWEWMAKQVIKGVSLAEVARQMSKKVSTYYGNNWDHKLVRTTLQNRQLIGQLHYRSKKGEQFFAARWEPLVDMNLWKEVNRVLAIREEGLTPYQVRGEYALGNLHCAYCGVAFMGAVFNDRGRHRVAKGLPKLASDEVRGYRHYAPGARCVTDTQRAAMKEHSCCTWRIRCEVLEVAVRDLILKQRASQEWAAAMRKLVEESLKDGSDQRSKITELEKEVADLEASLTTLTRQVELEPDDEMREFYASRARTVMKDRRAAKAALENARLEVAGDADVIDGMESMLDETEAVLLAWDTSSLEDRRRIFDWWVEWVDVLVDRASSRYGKKATLHVYLRQFPGTPISIPVQDKGMRSKAEREQREVFQKTTRLSRSTKFVIQVQDFGSRGTVRP